MIALPRPTAMPPPPPVSWPSNVELDALPSNVAHTIDIDFAHKIHLVGYAFDPESAKANEQVKLTFYWRCDDRVKEGWRLFTLLEYDDSDGWRAWGNAGVGPLRREDRPGHPVLGVDRWTPGKFYVDSQTFAAPSVVTDAVTVMAGIAKGSARLHVVAGPSDDENRGIVGKIAVRRE